MGPMSGRARTAGEGRSLACCLLLWLATWSVMIDSVYGYIPAVAVNDTSDLVNSNDTIHIAWQPNGVFSTGLSRQLVADSIDANGDYTNVSTYVPWSKFSKGVLIHFDESMAAQQPSVVPWIAMINCDSNGTVYTLDVDIFTIARDHGAQAALLYSPTSAGCLMNTEYLVTYQKVLDVYATLSVQGARLIESQFDNVGSSAFNFNSEMLNASADAINILLNGDALYVAGGDIPQPLPTTDLTNLSSVDGGLYPTSAPSSTDSMMTDGMSTTSMSDYNLTYSTLPSNMSLTTTSWITVGAGPTTGQRKRDFATPTQVVRRQASSTSTSALSSSTTRGANYLAAVMASTNITVGRAAPATTTTASGNNSNNNTSIAMIILYAITGVVTLMFLSVIVSGAVRAVRHPERYGPRAAGYGDEEGIPARSRAHGLTRAILDTFPVVRFGRTDSSTHVPASEGSIGGAQKDDIEMNAVTTVRQAPSEASDAERLGHDRRSVASTSAAAVPNSPTTVRASQEGNEEGADTNADSAALAIQPQDVDDATTCPICVCEFEEGESIRILPCDGRHRFHCECIDPWLLQVSSLCPLCRLDLSANSGAASSQQAQGTIPEHDQDDSEDEEAQERQIISNLRAMLPGNNRRRSSAAAQRPNSVSAGASSQDQQQPGSPVSPTGSASAAAAATTNNNGGGSTSAATAATRLAARKRFFKYVATRRRIRGTQ